MARISNGNALTSAMLQPGWTYQNDGYGLLTGTAKYRVNDGNEGNAILYGSVHPHEPDLFANKIQYTYLKNGIVELDVTYVGISSYVYSGLQTMPNMVPTGQLSSELIITNKNFFGSGGDPIAGNGTTFTESTIVPGEYVGGIYGAHFESSNGGKFLGFKDSSTNKKRSYYGKSNYMAPTTAFSGIVYIRNQDFVIKALKAAGKRNKKGVFGGINMFPDYLNAIDWQSQDTEYDQLLLTQVSVEDFCINSSRQPIIWKVNYEIKYSRDGYPDNVYIDANDADA